MRSAQVYRWQIPMDAGMVLRDRRLKTRDGLYVCLREGEREGWDPVQRAIFILPDSFRQSLILKYTWLRILLKIFYVCQK